jgi:hypothetical protein
VQKHKHIKCIKIPICDVQCEGRQVQTHRARVSLDTRTIRQWDKSQKAWHRGLGQSAHAAPVPPKRHRNYDSSGLISPTGPRHPARTKIGCWWLLRGVNSGIAAESDQTTSPQSNYMGSPVHSGAVRLWFGEHYGIRLNSTSCRGYR